MLSKLPIRYSLGLTATPYRKDGHHPILYMLSGSIRHEIKEDIDKDVKHTVFFQETSFRMSDDYGDRPRVHEVWNHLTCCDSRLSLISGDIFAAIKDKRNPLILSERKNHLKKMCDSLKNIAGMKKRKKFRYTTMLILHLD